MPFFSRLTDIVTCNLTAILAAADDPAAALREIVAEMQDGVTGAMRSMKTASGNVARLSQELSEQHERVGEWLARARGELARGDENHARQSLTRKREVEDLIAGLDQQRLAAEATQNHLATTLRALEARLADALRRQAESDFSGGETIGHAPQPTPNSPANARSSEIDAELDRLRQEIQTSKKDA